jgi:60 kDa SS-A/Ro ribonucleoprotein
MKTLYADVAEEIAAPARERLTKKQNKKLSIGISKQGGETYVLKNTDLTRFTRFLIMGTETGSFYQDAKELTRENTKIAQKQLDAGPDAVVEIMRVSKSGLAEKQDAILFSLALATRSKNDATRQTAYEALIPVCRTLSQLYTFLDYRFKIGGVSGGELVGKKIKNAKNDERYGGHASSMGLRKALQKWLGSFSDADLAYQMMKYQNRSGVSFRDVLRIARPTPATPARSALYKYAVKNELNPEMEMEAHERLSAARTVGMEGMREDAIADLIVKYNLPREVIGTQYLNERSVWEALLQDMPMMALIRNLGKMSSIELFKDSEMRKLVVDRLNDTKRIENSRVHPLNIYTALHTYEQGKGTKGSLSWTADGKIVDALNDAFDHSFKNVVPSGKSILLAIDTSWSMSGFAHSGTLSNAAGLAAILSLIILRSEDNVELIGISNEIHRNLGITGRMRPQDAMRQIQKPLGGGTDLCLPFKVVGKETDAIMLFTDSENGARDGLRIYQEAFLRKDEHRRLVLAQMVPNSSGWVRPTNEDWDNVGRKSLEISGFDPSIGKLTADFLAERF